MKRVFVLVFLIFTSMMAKENYSQMSTQELIEIIGFVDDKDKKDFFNELNKRVSKMTSFEKSQYEKRMNNPNEESKELEDEE